MSHKHQQLHEREKEILSTSTTMTFTSKNLPSPNAPQNFPGPAPNDENLELVQQQMKFVAHQQQRSTPPRCHPISIYILVQSLGCLLTGLTMLITAHWPGTGSRSSEVLKIVGPVLIAIGALLFVIGILLARVLDQSATMQQQSRQQLQSRSQQQPRPTAGPGSEEERIELLSSPDSIDKKMLGGKMAAASSSGSDAFVAMGDNDDVPEAVRMMKKRTKKKPGDASSSFENLQSVDEELGQGHRSGSRELYKTGRDKSRSREEIQERENEEEEEYMTGRKRIVTKTTTVVKTTTTKTKPEIKSRPDTKPPSVPDSPRLRIKIKATPGTQVNVRHSGTESESEDPKQKAKAQEKPKPKPKPKPKIGGGMEGTDI
ncbi:hypothetical protein HELRODRAFT_177061 [Helobdella robusta]|uniref:Uncharacterized protein n=1 Tax=Helobdella robusta TaxID=6412 RepID=T1FB68_HELRO|nr:hypothetical protein HELRODRAFT_177061 [Helobdella robusta]ESN98582.1 hypothetical protein HELRODRAFT_177061 [Helobdella robusta]